MIVNIVDMSQAERGLTREWLNVPHERYEAFAAVDRERERQIALFTDAIHSHDKMLGILGEEVGEVCKAVNEYDLANLEEELVQVAAVAVKWLEAIRRARR